MRRFFVIHFDGDNLISMVPTNWYFNKDQEEFCYWPPIKTSNYKLEHMIRTRAAVKADWDVKKCRRIMENHEKYPNGFPYGIAKDLEAKAEEDSAYPESDSSSSERMASHNAKNNIKKQNDFDREFKRLNPEKLKFNFIKKQRTSVKTVRSEKANSPNAKFSVGKIS